MKKIQRDLIPPNFDVKSKSMALLLYVKVSNKIKMTHLFLL